MPAMLMTEAFRLAVLADITTAVTGSLIGAEVELYTNDVDVLDGSLIGDFTIAGYTGYAAEAITWSAVTRADDGNLELIGIVGEFRPTDAVIPQTVHGFIVTDGGTAVLGGARFSNGPLPMGSALDMVQPVPRVRLANASVFDVIS